MPGLFSFFVFVFAFRGGEEKGNELELCLVEARVCACAHIPRRCATKRQTKSQADIRRTTDVRKKKMKRRSEGTDTDLIETHTDTLESE